MHVIAMGPGPRFPAQQSASHRRLRVLALGRPLLPWWGRVPGGAQHWRGGAMWAGAAPPSPLCPLSPIAYF